jgi:YgiT-type zinc finger domain-containing protein
MKRQAKVDTKEVKVAFEVVAGRQGGRGIFAIEDAAEEIARRTKLAHIAEQIASYDRGYVGNRRRCPQCGKGQQYKGERTREVRFDGGTVTVVRAYYVCPGCGTTSCPLDEQLGLVEGPEQGRLREKLALLAVVVPYHQAPQVCQTLLGREYPAMTLRRVALREAARFTASGSHHTLPPRRGERLYLEVDGHLCPTREPKDGPGDQGYREAKAVLAFSEHDVAEVSKERHEILHKILQAQSTDSEAFRSIFTEVYRRAHGEQAAEVIVLADGARWIWNMVEDVLPHAVQILDFSHAKAYLWEAAKIIYGEGSAFVTPWVKEREALLLDDKVRQIITHLQAFLDLRPALAPSLHYFEQNQNRMHYGTYRQKGYFIGSGAIESAGKQLAAGRIKGPGMRWNVTEVNALLKLRCMFLEQSWRSYWKMQGPLAA